MLFECPLYIFSPLIPQAISQACYQAHSHAHSQTLPDDFGTDILSPAPVHKYFRWRDGIIKITAKPHIQC